MLKCPICLRPIIRQDLIAVLGYPLEALNDEGKYDYVNDFLDNQKILHLECFNKLTRPQEPKIFSINSKTEEIYNALVSLGENCSRKDVVLFLIKNKAVKNTEDILHQWFIHR